MAEFNGNHLTTDGRGLQLRAADRKIGILKRFSGYFNDGRQPECVEHDHVGLLVQRIYGVALGYEDLNDHEELRRDPPGAVLAGKREIQEPQAGKSTLNRQELTPAGSPQDERYYKRSYSAEAIDELLMDIFLEAHPVASASA